MLWAEFRKMQAPSPALTFERHFSGQTRIRIIQKASIPSQHLQIPKAASPIAPTSTACLKTFLNATYPDQLLSPLTY
jgi:hypothetical protein